VPREGNFHLVRPTRWDELMIDGLAVVRLADSDRDDCLVACQAGRPCRPEPAFGRQPRTSSSLL